MMRLKSRYKKKKKKQTQACVSTSQSAYKKEEHTEILILAYLGMLELEQVCLNYCKLVVARLFFIDFQNLQQAMMADTLSRIECD